MILLNIVTNNSEARNKLKDLCFSNKPIIGEHLSILYFDEEGGKCKIWETTSVKKIIQNETNIEVETNNSTYVLVKYINNAEEEIVERLILNKGMRLRDAKELASQKRTPMETLEFLKSIK